LEAVSLRGDRGQEELVWHPAANPGGLFDVRLMRDVVVITAAGVGGGSLVYANVQLRAPREVRKTEEVLEPRTSPAQPALRKVDAFAAAGRRAGRPAERLPIATATR
jgi:cholesterol oxidase